MKRGYFLLFPLFCFAILNSTQTLATDVNDGTSTCADFETVKFATENLANTKLIEIASEATFCPVDLDVPVDLSIRAGMDCQLAFPDLTGLVILTTDCEELYVGQSIAVGTIVPTGTYEIEFFATNGLENSIGVTAFVDIVSPGAQLLCNSIVSVPLAEGQSEAYVNIPGPNFEGFCGEVILTNSHSGAEYPSGMFNAGVYFIEWYAVDDLSSEAYCTTVVIVSEMQDTDEPLSELDGFSNTDQLLDPQWKNEDHIPVVDMRILGANQNWQPMEGFFIPGCMDSTASNYDADATEDDGSCVYNCMIELALPPSVTIPANEDCSAILGDYSGLAEVVSDCDILYITQLPSPGTYVGMGQNIVEISVHSNDGEQVSDFMVVEVLSSGYSIACTADIHATIEPNETDVYVFIPAPEVSGFCGAVSVTNSLTGAEDPSGYYENGLYNIIWQVDDGQGGYSTCSTNIWVHLSNTEPMVALEGAEDDPGILGDNPNWNNASNGDNKGFNVNLNQEIKAYPNPMANQCTIDAGLDANWIMELYNYSGQIIRTEQFTGSQTYLQRNGIPSGYYIVRLNAPAIGIAKSLTLGIR